ncbi:hypothetical protein QUF72_19835 [Desulfobacterales bacterium HSG2]|nr:hypothetical protein [Desulfobacterales bacterium HSG2]
MNQILLFRSDGHEFPLEIVSRNEQKWVTRKQLSGDMGVSDLRELHSQLVRKGELREGTHFMTITVMYPDGNVVGMGFGTGLGHDKCLILKELLAYFGLKKGLCRPFRGQKE